MPTSAARVVVKALLYKGSSQVHRIGLPKGSCPLRVWNDLSTLETPVVVLACTNLEMRLDDASWERFSYRIELSAAEPGPWLMFARNLQPHGLKGVAMPEPSRRDSGQKTPSASPGSNDGS